MAITANIDTHKRLDSVGLVCSCGKAVAGIEGSVIACLCGKLWIITAMEINVGSNS